MGGGSKKRKSNKNGSRKSNEPSTGTSTRKESAEKRKLEESASSASPNSSNENNPSRLAEARHKRPSLDPNISSALTSSPKSSTESQVEDKSVVRHPKVTELVVEEEVTIKGREVEEEEPRRIHSSKDPKCGSCSRVSSPSFLAEETEHLSMLRRSSKSLSDQQNAPSATDPRSQTTSTPSTEFSREPVMHKLQREFGIRLKKRAQSDTTRSISMRQAGAAEIKAEESSQATIRPLDSATISPDQPTTSTTRPEHVTEIIRDKSPNSTSSSSIGFSREPVLHKLQREFGIRVKKRTQSDASSSKSYGHEHSTETRVDESSETAHCPSGPTPSSTSRTGPMETTDINRDKSPHSASSSSTGFSREPLLCRLYREYGIPLKKQPQSGASSSKSYREEGSLGTRVDESSETAHCPSGSAALSTSRTGPMDATDINRDKSPHSTSSSSTRFSREPVLYRLNRKYRIPLKKQPQSGASSSKSYGEEDSPGTRVDESSETAHCPSGSAALSTSRSGPMDVTDINRDKSPDSTSLSSTGFSREPVLHKLQREFGIRVKKRTQSGASSSKSYGEGDSSETRMDESSEIVHCQPDSAVSSTSRTTEINQEEFSEATTTSVFKFFREPIMSMMQQTYGIRPKMGAQLTSTSEASLRQVDTTEIKMDQSCQLTHCPSESSISPMGQPSTSSTRNPQPSASDSDDLTNEEKLKLRADLRRLKPEELKSIIQIIKDNESFSVRIDLTEFDCHLDLLQMSTLRAIKRRIEEILAIQVREPHSRSTSDDDDNVD